MDSGIAHIKKEYLLSIPTPDKNDVISLKTSDDPDSEVKEPPKKKQKFTGRNKNRPWVNIVPRSQKLCPQLWSIPVGHTTVRELCTFPNCSFSHDAEEYLLRKPEDLGDTCHSYKTYGKCRYGLICRFGKQHLDGIYNYVNEELHKTFEANPPVINNLDKELQQRLRKKKYDFACSIKVTNEIRLQVKERKNLLKQQKNGNTGNNLNGTATNGSTVDKASIPQSNDSEKLKDLNDGDGCGNNSEINKDLHPSDSVTSDLSKNDKHEPGETLDKNSSMIEPRLGPASDYDLVKLRSSETKKLDWRNKLYLAPLTTLGNLPFRRVCKKFGADITCSEMAVASQLLQGQMPEWALIKRHSSEDFYGVQLCASNVETMVRCTQLLTETTDSIDFLDINMGCPIDLIYKQGAGSALMRREFDVEAMVRSMRRITSCPVTLKMRTGIYQDTKVAHNFIQSAKLWDVDLITVHGRSREQRYLKSADWEYIDTCAKMSNPIPLYGNGDVLTYEDYNLHKNNSSISGQMIGRGALIKPWIFTEIKEQRHWDITAMERLDILKEFVNCGLEHWGSDTEGVEKTRRFLLEWLSFLYRYIPFGILEIPQGINQRPQMYKGRNELETLMASKNCSDWVKLSEMLLGKVPDDFEFLPKHKANSWG